MKHITRNLRKMVRDARYAMRDPGFTLVEVLASLAAFAIAFSVASTLFSASSGLQRRGTVFREVEQNGAFFMEFVGREVRNGIIDYDSYAAAGVNLSIEPVNTLKLLYRGSLTQREEVYLQSGKIYVKRERPAEPGVFDTSQLTGNTVIVDTLNFYVSPYAKCTRQSASCLQPRVTVVAKISFNTAEFLGADDFSAFFENTFSTRIYDF